MSYHNYLGFKQSNVPKDWTRKFYMALYRHWAYLKLVDGVVYTWVDANWSCPRWKPHHDQERAFDLYYNYSVKYQIPEVVKATRLEF